MPAFDIGGSCDAEWTDGNYLVGHNETLVPTAQPYACIPHGDPVEAEFHDGDVLRLEPNTQVCSGDHAMVRMREWTTVRHVFFEDREVRLVPLKWRYPEVRLDRFCDEIVRVAGCLQRL